MQGRPEPPSPPRTRTTGPASPPPTFFCQLLRVHRQGLEQAATPQRFGAGVSGEGGREVWGWGEHCGLAVRVAGRKRSPCASIPPACQPRKSQLLLLPGAAKGSAVRAEVPQRRRRSETPESLPTPHSGGPAPGSTFRLLAPTSRRSGAELSASPRKRIPTGASGCISGTGSGVRLHSAEGRGACKTHL